ncbi:glycine cleavage system protein GcvH [Enterococcus sp. DIV0242_7C1]|uniref:Glycine cleavage system H protein n=2 Tax=Enterococcus TaxID=1350 RepID=A0A200J8K3_9ENTE|nr:MULTISPECIES: glycine cleavage system protein GcvH [Enterococcus]MBO0470710.1 glycine cleavage system protein GcvH [Enterococcus sp. DIV0242_7C1]MCA5012381.1 glycine cleavage system protein GcvH [Enterococcus sp. S23]MCA5015632.1 glycine cleavage system protein GcvH [Enterococcus sp. S22(2020)]OUZ33159.1 glycine cleavage system H protein [Enterococcus sp. 9D6_DIV0238]GGC94492.1 glycine cleavage system H protein [Enterococcus wangshanyuanii]
MAKVEELKFSKSHEWVLFEGDKVKIGLSDYAQDQLGDIVFIDLPDEGDEVTKEESFADIESVKAVSEAYSPLTGTVSAVNEELLDSPELINSAPLDSWLIEVEEIKEVEDLLTAEEYKKFCEESEEA